MKGWYFMSLYYRAFLYVIRKRSKTLILFLILLVISTMVLSGITIHSATKTAQLNIRQSLLGMFTIDQNTDDPSKWVSRKVGSFGTKSYYAGTPLTIELADSIMKNVPGLKGYNATYTSNVIMSRVNGEALELLETDGEENWIDSVIAGYGDFGQTVSAFGSTNTAYDSYFASGYVKLTDGRHLTADSGNAAIINRQLAEKNGLLVGDKLILSQSSFKSELNGIDVESTKIEVEIIGLFEATEKSKATLSNWSMDNAIYTTLPVIRHVHPEMEDEGYEHINFYVDDPAQIDNIIADIKSLPNINPSDFVIHVDTSSIDSVMKPLTNLDKLITFLIILIIIIGSVVLYLVLANRVKERIRESGILLSLGIGKGKIIAQYMVEIIFISIFAFGTSLFCSSFMVKTFGDDLLEMATTDNVTDVGSESIYSKDGIFLGNSDDFKPKFEVQGNLTKIDMSVDEITAVLVFMVGFVIITAAVILAGVPVMRYKPREILSRMS